MVQPSYALPDALMLREHVLRHSPRPQRWYQRFIAPGLILGGLMLLMLAPQSPLGMGLPWLMIAGLFLWITQHRRAILLAQRGLRQIQELTALRRPDDAVAVAWHLLPDLGKFPEIFAQSLMLLGSNLMALRAWEPAIEAQTFLLQHVPDEHPTGRMLRAQRLLALLHDDRLSDADAQLRTLQHADLDPTTSALARLAQLFQQVKTHHDDDALIAMDRDDLRRTFAPLGTEAGYGFAMAALAAHRTQQPDLARQWWHRATLLIPPVDLAIDLPELSPLLALGPAPTLAQVMREDGLV